MIGISYSMQTFKICICFQEQEKHDWIPSADFGSYLTGQNNVTWLLVTNIGGLSSKSCNHSSGKDEMVDSPHPWLRSNICEDHPYMFFLYLKKKKIEINSEYWKTSINKSVNRKHIKRALGTVVPRCIYNFYLYSIFQKSFLSVLFTLLFSWHSALLLCFC